MSAIETETLKQARYLIRRFDSGILSTLFENDEGLFPMGSVAPYVCDLHGNLIILISDIAKHTKNIKNNDHVSFVVNDYTIKNKQAGQRISISGTAELQPDDVDEEISERYFDFFPHAKNFFKAHHFNFCVIKPRFIHYIQTFGKIFSFEGEQLLLQHELKRSDFQGALEHMNADHGDALLSICDKIHERKVDSARLLAIDTEGFHMKVGEDEQSEILYTNFKESIKAPSDLRHAFIDLYKA